MMTILLLILEVFKTGLFAVGGGLATLPFLYEMGEKTGWFTNQDVLNLLAVSESPPGPIGVNMATYVGFKCGGILGAVVSTLGLVTPSIAIIIIVAGFLQKFRQSKSVNAVFSGLRPASTALITVAGLNVALSVFVEAGGTVDHQFFLHWPSVILAVCVFLAMRIKQLKGLHPIIFIAIAAVAGAVFQF